MTAAVVITAPVPCSCGQVHHDFAPLGTFTPLPAAEFERLLEKGAASARELDALIAPMFGLGSHGGLVLR